jgi:hypothetical protein
LIAIGILHTWVSNGVDRSLARDMLVSDVSYVVPIPRDPLGPPEYGDMVTGLRNALFMEATVDGVAEKRRPVSGVVVFGLGVDPPEIIGVINAHAYRRFDPQLLPQIPFAETAIGDDGRVRIHWLDETEARSGGKARPLQKPSEANRNS